MQAKTFVTGDEYTCHKGVISTPNKTLAAWYISGTRWTGIRNIFQRKQV